MISSNNILVSSARNITETLYHIIMMNFIDIETPQGINDLLTLLMWLMMPPLFLSLTLSHLFIRPSSLRISFTKMGLILTKVLKQRYIQFYKGNAQMDLKFRVHGQKLIIGHHLKVKIKLSFHI